MEWNLINGEPVSDSGDLFTDEGAQDPSDRRVEIAFHELEIVAYVGELKIVGMAHFGQTGRVSSQRSSDYLRRFADSRLTLSQVRIYRHAAGELIDTTPFIILNLDRVDLGYAREIGSAPAGDPALGGRDAAAGGEGGQGGEPSGGSPGA